MLKFNSKQVVRALVAAGLISAAGVVVAATTSGTVTVSMTLLSACEVSASGAAISFGSVANLLSAGDTVANSADAFQVACSSDMSPVISSPTARAMTDTHGNFLPFNLSLTAGAAADDLPTDFLGATPLGIVKDGTLKPVTLYGKVLAANFTGSNAIPGGGYSTIVTVNVDY